METIYGFSVLSILGVILSLWIVIPAPNMGLLPLGIIVPEISPVLVVLNAIALVWGNQWISLLGLLLSLIPLVQFPITNNLCKQEIIRVTGEEYYRKFSGKSYGDIYIERDREFANLDGVKLYLNLYRPQGEGKYPSVIIIYGGAWRSGKPNNHEIFSRYLGTKGYTVIALDYRHAPEYRFPVQLEDIQLGLSYIVTHAQELKIDLNRVAIMGRSAGGHLATLTAAKSSPIIFKALINYYGPMDLTRGYLYPPIPDPINTRQVLLNFLGGTPDTLPELYKEASPISYIDNLKLPILFVYPSRDHLVKLDYARELSQQLKARGNPIAWLEIPWAEHAFDLVFWGLGNRLALYYTDVFLDWAIYSAER